MILEKQMETVTLPTHTGYIGLHRGSCDVGIYSSFRK